MQIPKKFLPLPSRQLVYQTKKNNSVAMPLEDKDNQGGT
jgi:hypothetical protein